MLSVRHGSVFFGVFLLLFAMAAGAQTADRKPAGQIDLAPLGYSIPTQMERLTDGEATASLNFLDATHILLTFDSKKLFHRLPTCPPEHQDRMMHAVVLDTASGKVAKEADWYLHDRRPYVWPFGAGKVLLRKLNDLYVVDADLHERLLWSSRKDLLWVAVTPDASQIIVETPVDPKPAPAAADAPKFQAQFIDATSLKPVRTIPLKQVVQLKGTRWGYEDLVKSGDVWLIRFGATPVQRHNLARVRSRTVPNVLYSSSNSLIVGWCPAVGCRYNVTEFSLSGQHLWRQHWPDFHWLPALARSANNDRFAVSALRIVHATKAPALDSASSANPYKPDVSDVDAFQQQIEVIDTASGKKLFTVGVHPAMMADQNFALSPDGRELAVVQDARLEVFDLPVASPQEQAEFAKLQASLPVFALSSASAADGVSSGDPNSASNGSDPAATAHVATPDSNTFSAGTNIAGTPGGGSVPTFKVTTKAVLLDVVVTDKKGNPIHGLDQQEFHVTEDGKPQDIRYFKETELNDAPAAKAPEDKPGKPKRTNIFSNHAPAASSSNTLVLVDFLNTPSQDQEYAQQQLIKFLQSKPKSAQIALCALNAGGPHLKLIQDFTPDEATLLAAARGKKRMSIAGWQASAKGTADASETVSDLAKEGRTSGFQGLASALQGAEVEQQGSDTDKRVAITLQALISLSRYLAGIPGRKNVVWLSGSFPVSLPSSMNTWDPSVENRNYSRLIKSVTNQLADAQIAVYPVDVRGLLGGGISAEMASASGGAPTGDSGPQDLNAETVKAPTAPVSSDQQALSLAAMERASEMQVAAATGGKAFYNSNGISKAIQTAVEQGSNYYTLSYSPSNKTFDGRFRTIKVALAQKGYVLHYRAGYFAESDEDNSAELARKAREAAMELGAPASRQLAFSVRVVPTGGKKKVDRQLLDEASKDAASLPAKIEVQHYNIDYSFAATDLSFQAAANGGRRSALILMIASYDKEGRRLTASSSAAMSELLPSEYAQVIGGKVALHQEVDIPEQAKALRIGIQDRISGHIGTVEMPLPLPRPASTESGGLPQIEPD